LRKWPVLRIDQIIGLRHSHPLGPRRCRDHGNRKIQNDAHDIPGPQTCPDAATATAARVLHQRTLPAPNPASGLPSAALAA
jgi:hypothetical protein